MKEAIKKIVGERVVIHIKTPEQMNKLNEVARELRIRPLMMNHDFAIRKGDFCVRFSTYSTCWDNLSYYRGKGYKIVEFDDLCKNNTIVIYQKGDKVIALDKRTGKKAVAKCDPRDTFDFNIGAKLAFERLIKNVTFRVLAIEPWDPLLTKGKIYEFVDGKTTWDNGKISSKYDDYTHLINNNKQLGDGVLIELKDGDNPKEILKEYATIKEGDTVKVINNGETYTSYNNWLEHYFKDGNRYMWDIGHTPDNGSIGKVELVAPWTCQSSGDKSLLALVNINRRYYIIGVEGLEKLHKEDTYGIFG